MTISKKNTTIKKGVWLFHVFSVEETAQLGFAGIIKFIAGSLAILFL